jgi:adenosylcobinamide kinase/adenosylcobinamide-phosphate guanylyltransferase
MARPLLLVLGGTRSGKSTYGLSRMAALAGDGPVAYLATVTSTPGEDPELDDRIARHRASRPAAWETIDVGVDLPGAIARTASERPILLDGLTLWLAALMAPPDARPKQPTQELDALIDGPIAAGLAALDRHRGPAVIVSDEIGLGMVPMDAVARAFRDLQGIVHQRLAAMADEVVLTVAGLPWTLKAPES